MLAQIIDNFCTGYLSSVQIAGGRTMQIPLNRKLSIVAVCSLTKVSSSVLIDGEVLNHLGNFFFVLYSSLDLFAVRVEGKGKERDRTRWKSFSSFSPLPHLSHLLEHNKLSRPQHSTICPFCTFPGFPSRLQDDLTTIVVEEKLLLHFCLTFNAISS